MDKALKQRLVGASVLIALAVVVLPMLLSGPPERGTSQSQKIELPPRPDEVTFETRRFPLGESDDERDSTAPEAPVTERLPEPESAAKPTGSSPAETASEAQGEGAEAAGDVEVTPAERRMPPPEVTEEPAPEVVVQPPQRAPAAADAATGRYVIQVASLGSEANARKLTESLQKMGLPVLVDTVSSDVGRLNRVRVGPYDTEVAANDVLRKIRESVDGVSPRLVDLQPDDAGPVTNPGDPMVRWVVQVGSFSDAANAEGLVQRLRKDGMSAYEETVTSAGGSIHRVRVGPFLNREDATAARQQLIAVHSLEGVVMSAD